MRTRQKATGKKATQLPLPFKRPHGGKRKGAGRKNRTGLQGHARRARLNPRVPVHVTLKLAPNLPSLRRKDIFRQLRAALLTARKRGFGVTHYSILSNHVHLILEPGKNGISVQLQSLCISFAKRMNHALARSGAVFHDRYHIHVLRTPTEARRALAYVLTNDAQHASRTRAMPKLRVRLDPFSSALAFREWRGLLGRSVVFLPSAWPDHSIEDWHKILLISPKTWLLKTGWKRAHA